MVQTPVLTSLRHRFDAAASAPRRRLELGHAGLDTHFGGGALPLAAAHEVTAASVGDTAAASGFVQALIARLQHARPGAWTLLVQEGAAGREDGLDYGPGLHALGVDPGRLVFVSAPSAAEVLRVADEAVRSGAVGLVAAELWTDERRLDLAATKRFNLAADRTGTGCLLLTRRPAATSAAVTRWTVAARPGRAAAGLLGAPSFELELTRNRFGRTGRWPVEWDCHDRFFRTPAGALNLVRPAGDRSPAQAEHRARDAHGGRRQVG